MNENSNWSEFKADFLFWDRLLRTIFKRIGGDPYTPLYRFVDNDEFADVLPYGGVPSYPGYWANGKQFIGWMQAHNKGMQEVPYEQILNTDPAYTYMRSSSSMALNIMIIAHAACGHSHFFKHNYMFAKSGAATILQRMAKWQQRFKELEGPHFGIERLEYTLDAALVLADYGTDFADETRVPEAELRRRLETQMHELETEIEDRKTGFDVELLKKRVAALKRRLAKDPINRRRDIGTFLLDPKNNPGLSDEERDIISIAFEIQRYFNGQGETKFMNEGFASWCHKLLPQDPQASLPANFWMELLWFWTMFDRSPMEKYTNPYGVTLFLLDRQSDEEHCPVTGEEEAWFPVFETYPNPEAQPPRAPAVEGSEPGAASAPAIELPMDKTRIAYDLNGNLMVFTGEWRKGTVKKRDYSHIFGIIKNYRDTSFFREFLTNDAIEALNDESIHWIDEQFRTINERLLRNGWDKGTTFNPIPATLAGKMEAVRTWMALSRNTRGMREQAGVPIFPVPPIVLSWMSELLQLISAYHSDKTKFRQQLLLKLSLVHHTPDISIVDGGIDSENDGTLVLEHLFDPATGFLRQSWTEEAIKLLPRLWKRGNVCLLTKEGTVNEVGDVEGVHDYFYMATREGGLKKGKVEQRKS